jgi:hypothetical protein
MLRRKALAGIGVRGVTQGVAGVGVCAAALLLAAGAAQAHSIHIETKTCEGKEEHRVIKGKLRVSPGTNCILFFDTVDGNVSVAQGANFILGGHSVITGSLSTEGANSVCIADGSEVDENVSIDATSGTVHLCRSSVIVAEDKFGGNVSITNTSPSEVIFAENVVAQDLTCTGNASVTNVLAGVERPNTVLGQEFGQCVGL